MNKLTEIRRKYTEPQVWAGDPDDVLYLISLLEEKDKALEGQHRYFERISVTFGEFECQRLAKEAMEKYTSSNNEGE